MQYKVNIGDIAYIQLNTDVAIPDSRPITGDSSRLFNGMSVKVISLKHKDSSGSDELSTEASFRIVKAYTNRHGEYTAFNLFPDDADFIKFLGKEVILSMNISLLLNMWCIHMEKSEAMAHHQFRRPPMEPLPKAT